MIGKTISHYKILEKLGEGGMGVVYKAEDIKLKREVAIKFLPRFISANKEESQRFEIEAQAAASLNHPNITHIYAIEDTDDEMFIVMELIDGLELKEKIKTGPINIKEATNIAVQIAEGLKAAHKNSVVHRDIKSSNIMITKDGKVKIMDFGLAKIKGGSELTKAGTTLGTVAYMSPEQARGKTVEHSTDIWSFGVVLYEMLTGNHPFKGDYEQAVIYAILNEEPENIQSQRLDVPDKLVKVINKMLAKNPEARFQSMEDILNALGDIEKTTKPFAMVQNEEYSSIAVLPFTDMSPARDQDYFCEGVAEEILNSLSKIEGLKVVSRTSSFMFKKGETDVKEIGKRLKVKSVLEGSVRKAGNLLRISVQLTNVLDGFYLWSERYDRELEDVFSIQENIAENVAIALRGVLTPKEKEALRRPETVIEAYEHFLKGRHFLYQIVLDEAMEFFEKAIKQDSNYAPAYAGLADAYSWLYEWRGSDKRDLEAAKKNSRKALELAPHLAESHTSRGYVLSLDKKYKEAEKEFLEAIRLNSNSFDACYFYARSCFARGEIEKSVGLFRKASEVNREDFQSLSLLEQSLSALGRKKEAEDAVREAIRRAENQLEFDPTNRRTLSLGAHSLYSDGQEEKSFEWMNKALELYPDDQGVLTNYACLMAKMGRKKEALDVLEKIFGKGYGKKDWIEHDPDYDSLRDDPRFQALLKKL